MWQPLQPFLQPFDVSPFLCYTKQGNGEGVRHQTLTNTQERNPDNVATFATFLATFATCLQPVCNFLFFV